MTFKVGDKVRVVREFDSIPGGPQYVACGMDGWIGRDCVIERIIHCTAPPENVGYRVKGCGYTWHPSSLKLLTDIADEIDAVKAEADAIIRDAMRYRMLRKAPSGIRINSWTRRRTEELDESIDKFMAEYDMNWNRRDEENDSSNYKYGS